LTDRMTVIAGSPAIVVKCAGKKQWRCFCRCMLRSDTTLVSTHNSPLGARQLRRRRREVVSAPSPFTGVPACRSLWWRTKPRTSPVSGICVIATTQLCRHLWRVLVSCWRLCRDCVVERRQVSSSLVCPSRATLAVGCAKDECNALERKEKHGSDYGSDELDRQHGRR
jgi:hypothetical protein